MIEAMRRWARVLLGLAVTVLFIWLFLRHAQFEHVVAALARITVLSLGIALAFLAADYALRIVRWWLMLRALGSPAKLTACVWPFLVSIAVNNVLPLRAGDALRVVGFRKELRAPAMQLLGVLFIERILDLLVLLGFFFLGLAGVTSGLVPRGVVQLSGIIAAGAVVGVLLLFWFSRDIDGAVRWIATLPIIRTRGWANRLERHVRNLLGSARLFREAALFLQLVALSVAIWALEGAVFAAVAVGIDAAGVGLGPWFAMATGTLSTLLPSSPGYVGTFDYFTTLGLGAYGAASAEAGAFAVTVHVVLWLPLTLAGLIYFMLPRAGSLRRAVDNGVSDKGSA